MPLITLDTTASKVPPSQLASRLFFYCPPLCTFSYPGARRIGYLMPPLFPLSSSSSGKGSIHLTLLPPAIPSFSTLSYAYPLKLLPSAPHILSSPSREASLTSTGQNAVDNVDGSSSSVSFVPARPLSVPLVFVVTYGGGLLAGDCIDLNIHLDPFTRLTIATQGSTKVYKTPTLPSNDQRDTHAISETGAITNANNPFGASRGHIGKKLAPDSTSRQDFRVRIGIGAGIWFGTDPIQPFAGSRYAQTQIFEVEKGASMGAVDWVTEGRRACNESWAMEEWRGRNEIWGVAPVKSDNTGKGPTMERKVLMVRDSVILHPHSVKGGIKAVVAGAGVFGTILLYGSIFASLSEFFLSEFSSLPRIGGRNWNSDEQVEEVLSARQRWRKERLENEKADGVLWTAARVRGGVTVVKFSAAQVEGGRAWLGCMLKEEASVRREFGDGALMFVR